MCCADRTPQVEIPEGSNMFGMAEKGGIDNEIADPAMVCREARAIPRRSARRCPGAAHGRGGGGARPFVAGIDRTVGY